jgi:hypothetical protein
MHEPKVMMNFILIIIILRTKKKQLTLGINSQLLFEQIFVQLYLKIRFLFINILMNFVSNLVILENLRVILLLMKILLQKVDKQLNMYEIIDNNMHRVNNVHKHPNHYN